MPYTQPSVPVLRVSEPRDLVAMVPYRLGFAPDRSLVLVSLRGPRSRIGLVLRVDLPPAAETELVVDQVTRFVRQDGADRAVAVVYDDPGGDHDRLLDALLTSMRRERVELLDAWHVGADHFRSLMCRDACCPIEGWPVSDLQASRMSAEMVALGIGVAPSRAQRLPDLGPADADGLAAVEQVVRAGAPGPDDDPVAWRTQGIIAWRELLDAQVREQERGDPVAVRPFDGLRRRERIGTVLARLGDPWVRDALLLTAVPGAGDAPESMAADGPRPRTQRLLDGVFGPGEPSVPDPDLLVVVRGALAVLVRHATGPRRAAPLAAMAWAAWWAGDGASAGDLADRALEDDPANRLAQLIDCAVLAGMAPPWVEVFRESDLQGTERTASP